MALCFDNNIVPRMRTSLNLVAVLLVNINHLLYLVMAPKEDTGSVMDVFGDDL